MANCVGWWIEVDTGDFGSYGRHMAKLIAVGNNYAIVDDEDYPAVSNRKWYMMAHRYAGTYRRSNGHYRPLLMHRFIMGDEPGIAYDHINGFGLDNRRCNLRIATQAQNSRNSMKYRAKPDKEYSSKYKGVYFRKDRMRWSAYIGGSRGPIRRQWLGCYASEGHAAEAYNKAAKELFGEFAKLNEIDPGDFS